MKPAPGDVIGGKYRIVRLIGDGGMGTVYEAHHEFLETSVALKFLHAELAQRAGLGSRFLQEARVSARIRSPHVTHVTDVDQTADGSPYLVMELLHGEPLQQAMDRRGKLPPEQAVDFALQILSGLESAHAIGVVHRDLKPDNVFIVPATGGPLLKLIDFGIAKLRASTEFQKGLTRAGVIMGTPEYMAPEQLFAAENVDHRADLYSLGVILFEMLSGPSPRRRRRRGGHRGLGGLGQRASLGEPRARPDPGFDRDRRARLEAGSRRALRQRARDAAGPGAVCRRAQLRGAARGQPGARDSSATVAPAASGSNRPSASISGRGRAAQDAAARHGPGHAQLQLALGAQRQHARSVGRSGARSHARQRTAPAIYRSATSRMRPRRSARPAPPCLGAESRARACGSA